MIEIKNARWRHNADVVREPTSAQPLPLMHLAPEKTFELSICASYTEGDAPAVRALFAALDTIIDIALQEEEPK